MFLLAFEKNVGHALIPFYVESEQFLNVTSLL